ncbi:MAG: thiamine phosphate synthase [Burkholderiales bacterium]|jgi:thiamine-phosphate pyrophosphorylase|nr:thiamine phosphate synthase [Burkholderiales bacterium]
MNNINLKLYLVLDPILCGGIEGMVKTAMIAAENGVTVVQLRAESMDKRMWFDAAIALKRALADVNVPLIINNHIDVAQAVDADGVHVGQRDLPVESTRQIIGKNKILGLSVSNIDELRRADGAMIDYLGIGPVFPTTSKKNAAPALGLAQLKQLTSLKHCPAVAIGGIGHAQARDVLSCGVEGIAVVSAICGQPDVAAATRAFINALNV